MLKKIVIFLLILWQLNVQAKNSLDIKANIESWTYNNTIEINLIATEPNAKIFYYMDSEWRMDNQFEFKKEKPIVIKKDTILNYYAIWEGFTSTKIKENNYKIVYSNKIDISYKDKIIIKNNSSEVQNIWYWKIEANNLIYEIYKNTFLNPNETYKLDYKAEELEIIKLISPDEKIKKEIRVPKAKKKIIVENKNIEENLQKNYELSWSKFEEEKNDINENTIFNKKTPEKEIEKKEFKIEDNLKASAIETKNNNNILIIFILLFSIWIIYQIYLLAEKKWFFKKIKVYFKEKRNKL